jgi:hypothetical protein
MPPVGFAFETIQKNLAVKSCREILSQGEL